MKLVSQGSIIRGAINLIDNYYQNNPSTNATIWKNESSQPGIFQLRHDRLLKLYKRRSESVTAKLSDGDIPFPSAKYFLKANQYQIPAIIAQGISQLLAFEYMKPDRNAYQIFMTFCVDKLTQLYKSTFPNKSASPKIDQIIFLRANLEVLIGACTDRCLMIKPQDLISATEASVYDAIFKHYPLQRNYFFVRLSAYYYMNLLFPVKGIRNFKYAYDQIISLLKSDFTDDYINFINSKPMSTKASDYIYIKTNIALNEDTYLHEAANNEPQNYLMQILDSFIFD
ncbi:hypothetical protein EFO88_02280 [Lactiplantibacillus plantarum]|uniref:hypothetical protein n=1 Tax=Lactiplantibacillus plantarum TaxID=1590 RepID=UPI0021A28048|nr:hypothetical protein [Lactiplantibacillus plantarum]MCT3248881.1 hypothetical protein [Lactiplantibacillus plantarum]